MNRERVKRFPGAIGVVLLLGIFCNSTKVAARSMQSQDASKDQILNASVQITMSVFMGPAGGSPGISKTSSNKLIAHGIGSLIEDHGKVLLVTHNHWGEALQEYSLVEIRAAGNELLLRMFGFEFKERILFQDAGTLILQAPEQVLSSHSGENGESAAGGLRMPAKPWNRAAVSVGAIVQVTFRKGADRQQVGLLEAEVIAIQRLKGLPVFKLRNLSGQPLRQGDSGGGVWFKGELVGNTWATLVTGSAAAQAAALGAGPEPDLAFTDLSLAAVLPITP